MINTHLVSKVLIRQFCSNGKTNVYNIKNKAWELPKSPIEIASIPIPKVIIEKSEKKWNKLTEIKFNNVMNDLEKGLLFKKNGNIDAIKSLIGLHYIRSFAFTHLFSIEEKNLFNESLGNLMEISNFSPEQLRMYWVKNMSEFFPKLLNDQLEKVLNYISKQNLVIGIAPKRNRFILGDNPVVNISEDDRIGYKEKVALMESTTVFLPLSPKYVVALVTKSNYPKFIKLSAKHVRNINSKTKRNCMREFYAN